MITKDKVFSYFILNEKYFAVILNKNNKIYIILLGRGIYV